MIDFSVLEQTIEERMGKAKVPGLALAVVQEGKVILARGFGVTSVEEGGMPVTPDTLFPIGSTTKPLTGTAIMRLVDAGALDLDCPISTYLPWLTFQMENAENQITLRMLVSHTAGFCAGFEDCEMEGPEGLARYVREEIPRTGFIAPPGKVGAYSSAGINLAGYIAEAVSRIHFSDLVQELVFEPLGMARTTFDTRVAMTYPLALPHVLDEQGKPIVYHRFFHNAAFIPAGLAYSTVNDLAHFAMMQMDQGRFRGKQVLSPGSVKAMQSLQTDLHSVTGAGFGLTFFIEDYKGCRLVSHPGSIGNFGSMFMMAPDDGVAVVMLFNYSVDFWGSAGQITEMVFDQILDLPEETPKLQVVEPERASWPLYVGTYLDLHSGLALIQIEEDQLVLDWNGLHVPLLAAGSELYYGQLPGGEGLVSVGFIPEEGCPVQYIHVRYPGPTTVCRRIEPDPVDTLDPAAWEVYTGTYYGDIITIEVRIREGGLYLFHREHNLEFLCMPLGGSRFACDYGLIEFRAGGEDEEITLELGSVVRLKRAGFLSDRVLNGA